MYVYLGIIVSLGTESIFSGLSIWVWIIPFKLYIETFKPRHDKPNRKISVYQQE